MSPWHHSRTYHLLLSPLLACCTTALVSLLLLLNTSSVLIPPCFCIWYSKSLSDLYLNISRDHGPFKGLSLKVDHNYFYANCFFRIVISGSRSEEEKKHTKERVSLYDDHLESWPQWWAIAFPILLGVLSGLGYVHQHHVLGITKRQTFSLTAYPLHRNGYVNSGTQRGIA